MDGPWLSFTSFAVVALVAGVLITFGSRLLREPQSNPPRATPPRTPLARWGENARETFWFTMGVAATLALIEGIFGVSLSDGIWSWVRLVNAIVWIGAAIVWVWAVIQRRRNAGTTATT
jgi:hypothetical protein